MKYLYSIWCLIFLNSYAHAETYNLDMITRNPLLAAGSILIKKNPQQLSKGEFAFVKKYAKELLLLMVIHHIPRNKEEEAFLKELYHQYDDLMKFYKQYKSLKANFPHAFRS